MRFTRNFLVHPLVNVVPEIRITGPADNQEIAAGTFRIKVGVVATDDRWLTKNSLNGGNSADVEPVRIYANGVALKVLSTTTHGDAVSGGQSAIDQAYSEINASLVENYGPDVAEDYAHAGNPYSIETGYVLEIPAGLVRFNEPLKLTAYVYDTENAVGSDEITLSVVADNIMPEPVVLRPEPGFGPPEFSDFTLGVRAYDNVKVERISVFTTYGLLKTDGNYVQGDYALIREINSIPAVDYETVTTVNIDSPEYEQKLHTDRLSEILNGFPGAALADVERFDIWVKVTAYDIANQQSREVSYPVRADERPVMDIIEPIEASAVVENTDLYVNVNAFDDVGIAYVRLVATYGNGQPNYEFRLRQPPYNFSVPVPAYNADTLTNNIDIVVEAIDTYGDAFGDLDNHRVEEPVSVRIVGDQPPVVAIGQPLDGAEIIEGQYLLVQINAIDDVGVDRVALNVDGLKDGGRSFTDLTFPYEFLVEVPYGQAGKDLSLTASVTESRQTGARTISTLDAVTVHVLRDDLSPVVNILQPVTDGATVVERHSLPYSLDVTDNVKVGSVRLSLFADADLNGVFDDAEVVEETIMLSAPFSGSIALRAIDDYVADPANAPDQLAMMFKVIARDGIGNETVKTLPVTMLRNTVPEVTGIRPLDSRGFSLGVVDEIAEGHGLIFNVLARDAEAGVDSAALYIAIGTDEAELKFSLLGEDNAVPFNFHYAVPVGKIGQSIFLRATARDVDGYESEVSPTLLKIDIVADKPPTANIVKPDNDNSVIIDGQNIEVFVDAFDDLGPEGIDRVVFYVNGQPRISVYESYSAVTGSFAQQHVYRAEIPAPEGVDGFTLQAIAYDGKKW